MKSLHTIAFVLLIIGGLNWGLVGLFNWDLVAWLAGVTAPVVGTVVYVLVGLSAVLVLFGKKGSCGSKRDAAPAAPAAGPTPTV